jgi:hypothetical protein
MPWQVDLFMLIGEMRQLDDGMWVPAYREVSYSTPRQSGKTTGLVTFSVDRNVSWDRPTLLAWSAQSGSAARAKWIKEIFPRLENPKTNKLHPLYDRSTKGKGEVAAMWRNGSRIDIVEGTKQSGHGDTIDASVKDEIFADTDARRDQALDPAMVTVADAQSLSCSTAGDASSTEFNRKRRLGRKAVAEDTGHGMAYLEYSAPADWDPEDETSYWGFMPALGHTIGLEAIRHARTVTFAENPDEFRRAYGNISSHEGKAGVLPEEEWQRVCAENVSPDGGLVFGVAVSADRTMTAVAVADDKGRVELVDYRPGTGWVIEEVNRMAAAVGARIEVDRGGPAGSLADGFEPKPEFTGGDMVKACGAFYDAVHGHDGLTVRTHPLLDRAAGGVVKKMVSDAFVWSRRGSVEDVTPLEAATIAWAAARGSGIEVFAF